MPGGIVAGCPGTRPILPTPSEAGTFHMKKKKTKVKSTPHATLPNALPETILLHPALLHRQAHAISFALARVAFQGDRASMRLCIERLFPIPRERAVPLEILHSPASQSAFDVEDGLQSVFDALRDGRITPGEAAKLTALLDSRRKAFETGDLEARLRDLEKAPSGRGDKPHGDIDYDSLPMDLTPDPPDDAEPGEPDEPDPAPAPPPASQPPRRPIYSIVNYPAIQRG